MSAPARYMQPPVFVDLDSTLCDTRHRHHLVTEPIEDMDWEMYALASADDPPFPGAVKIVQMLYPRYRIVVVSQRHMAALGITVQWLGRNKVLFDDLLLDDGCAPGQLVEYKFQRISAYLAVIGRKEPALVIEDQPTIKDRLEQEGWPVLLLNPDYDRNRPVRM